MKLNDGTVFVYLVWKEVEFSKQELVGIFWRHEDALAMKKECDNEMTLYEITEELVIT